MPREANSLLLISRSIVSGREAYISEEIDSIWLYLSRP